KAKYRASRFCINVSAFEGFPKTVYESMAFGAVPILSRLDSYEGFLTEGENVFYADEPIAESVARIILHEWDTDLSGMQKANAALVQKVIAIPPGKQFLELVSVN